MNKSFVNVTEIGSIFDVLNSINDRCLVVYSPTSIKSINYNVSNIYNFVSTTKISKNTDNINKYISEFGKSINHVISIGGGTAIDIGKYISNQLNCMLTVVPAMLSTNAYATNKVALISNGQKNTLDSKLPDKIILDYDLIKKSLKYNLYGIADILSIHTALNDWKLAEQDNIDKIDNKIYNMANDLLKGTIDFIHNNKYETFNSSIDQLYYTIGQAGYITNIYGTGRPESGSEHILAKAIEQKFDVHHGISVTIAIIIMSIIQENIDNDIYECFRIIKIIDDVKNCGISKNVLFSILKNLNPRSDRYSVVNKFSRDDDYLKSVLYKYEKVLQGDDI